MSRDKMSPDLKIRIKLNRLKTLNHVQDWSDYNWVQPLPVAFNLSDTGAPNLKKRKIVSVFLLLIPLYFSTVFLDFSTVFLRRFAIPRQMPRLLQQLPASISPSPSSSPYHSSSLRFLHSQLLLSFPSASFQFDMGNSEEEKSFTIRWIHLVIWEMHFENMINASRWLPIAPIFTHTITTLLTIFWNFQFCEF